MAQARHAFIAIYACSGAAGRLDEIVWTRLLSLHMGQTVAATATVLAAFMGGLAVGAFAGGAAAARLASSAALRAYAFLEVAIAAYAAGVPAALGQFDRLLRAAYTDSPDATFTLARLITSLALVFIPAAAMGATFPLAVRWFAGGSTASLREASRLYAWNTIGAAVGALAHRIRARPAAGPPRFYIRRHDSEASFPPRRCGSSATATYCLSPRTTPPTCRSTTPRGTGGGRRSDVVLLGHGELLRGNLPEAIARAEQVVRRNPRHTLAHTLIGRCRTTAPTHFASGSGRNWNFTTVGR